MIPTGTFLIVMSSVLLDGSLVGALPAPCVGQKLLEEIDSWKRAGASVNDVLDRLRLNCVPSGYTPTPWSAGICDTYVYVCNTYTYTHRTTSRDPCRQVKVHPRPVRVF